MVNAIIFAPPVTGVHGAYADKSLDSNHSRCPRTAKLADSPSCSWDRPDLSPDPDGSNPWVISQDLFARKVLGSGHNRPPTSGPSHRFHFFTEAKVPMWVGEWVEWVGRGLPGP